VVVVEAVESTREDAAVAVATMKEVVAVAAKDARNASLIVIPERVVARKSKKVVPVRATGEVTKMKPDKPRREEQ